MQIVEGDSQYEMSKPIFCKKNKKNICMLSAEFVQSMVMVK